MFILGRWIIENQVVVHKLLHNFKVRKVKTDFMAIMFDLQKLMTESIGSLSKLCSPT